MAPLLILLGVLQLGDWLTTRRNLASGGREYNPALRWLMGVMGVDLALAAKCAFVMGLAIGVTTYIEHPAEPYVIGALCLFYVWIVWGNWRRRVK